MSEEKTAVVDFSFFVPSRQKEYSALVTAAAKKNGKKLSSELEFELQTGKQGGEEEAGKEVVEDATYDYDDVIGDGDGDRIITTRWQPMRTRREISLG